MTTGSRIVRAPRGTDLTARSWQTEAPLRMLMNNLDPEVAEDPDHLVVYGGTGKAARDWAAFDAIVRELTEGTSRWATVGIVVDWADWDRLHRAAGLLPPKDERPLSYESMLYDASTGGGQIGYTTSFCYSPVLQRHIGLARVRPDLATAGSSVHLELAISHHNTRVAATTAKLPLFNPARKTS